MRQVEVLRRQGNTYVPSGDYGAFHQFGITYSEFETGPGHYTTAIVEMNSGIVKNVPAEAIRFTGREVPE